LTYVLVAVISVFVTKTQHNTLTKGYKLNLLDKHINSDIAAYDNVAPLDKDDFVSYFSSNANPTQLKSLILDFKYGMLKRMGSRASVQLLRSKGAGSHAAILKKTMEHYNINVVEIVQALQAAKNIADANK